MSSDELEDVAMGDIDVNPAFSFKGKGKAVEEDYTHNENLPWYVELPTAHNRLSQLSLVQGGEIQTRVSGRCRFS